MSTRLLLRTFVNERLAAAVEEIFQVFEEAIAKYEEEATSSKQEIERLRCLLQESDQNRETSLLSICKAETSPKLHHCEQELTPRMCQEDLELLRIKQECQQHEEEQLHPSLSSTMESKEEGYTKLHLQPQIQMGEKEPLEAKSEPFAQPPASMLSSQNMITNERVQDDFKREGPVACSTSNLTQTDHRQSTFSASKGSAQTPYLKSVVHETCCHLCDKPFSSYHDLINHACHMLLKDTGFPCVVCSQTFGSTESLNLHLKSHKGMKCCHLCGKRCNDITVLVDHMASHAGVKLHRCQVCGKECSRKGDLKIHMRFHTGEKPYYCSLCNKGFTHSGHLRKHMRSHTGERPHQCQICGRGFLQNVHLKNHLGTHRQKC